MRGHGAEQPVAAVEPDRQANAGRHHALDERRPQREKLAAQDAAPLHGRPVGAGFGTSVARNAARRQRVRAGGEPRLGRRDGLAADGHRAVHEGVKPGIGAQLMQEDIDGVGFIGVRNGENLQFHAEAGARRQCGGLAAVGRAVEQQGDQPRPRPDGSCHAGEARRDPPALIMAEDRDLPCVAHAAGWPDLVPRVKRRPAVMSSKGFPARRSSTAAP